MTYHAEPGLGVGQGLRLLASWGADAGRRDLFDDAGRGPAGGR
ncbi:helix-turn-helix domain-containing protein [Streptomyces californicus]